MYPINPFLTHQRSLRFTCPLAPLLESVATGGPLYVHARNWLAELAAITPLTGIVIDDEEKVALLPEVGLQISLKSIEAVHGVEIRHRESQVLAVEMATRGEPRSISIAAIPRMSDMDHFIGALRGHPSETLREEEYQQWRNDFIIRPKMCPCCAAAAEERRAAPENNPLTRIFCSAIGEKRALRCSIVSPHFSFATWLAPKSLQFSGGVIGVIAEDGKSMLEVDTGLCYLLKIVRRRFDGESFTVLKVYDSMGILQLEISTHGWEAERSWHELCQGR